MPRNLRDFWVELDVDGYANGVARGPKRRGGGFQLDIAVASHGESEPLVQVVGLPLTNGKNRVMIEIARDLTAAEYVLSELSHAKGHQLILEETRECHCLRGKDYLKCAKT